MTIIFEQSTHTVTEDDITASTVQTQGERPLIAENNIITTVANDNDVVTLAPVEAGFFQRIINEGANTLQIFPALGQDLGDGVNISTTLIAGDHIEFLGLDGISIKNIAATIQGLAGLTSPLFVDLDFGGFLALNVAQIQSNNTPRASGGFISMAAINPILWRNNSDTSDNGISWFFDAFRIEMDFNLEYSFSATLANWNGNNLINVGFFESADTNLATTGTIRLGNTEKIGWRNFNNTENITLDADINNSLNIVGGQGLSLENDHSINWANSDKRRILNDTIGFEFGVDVGDNFIFKVDTVAEYTFDSAQADFKGNNIVDLSNLEFRDTVSAPANTSRAIFATVAGLNLNVASGDTIDLKFNGTREYAFANDEANWEFNNIEQMGILSFIDPETSIQMDGGNLAIDVDLAQSLVLRVNDVIEYNFSSTEANWLGNNLVNVNFMEMPEITVPTTPTANLGRFYVKDVSTVSTPFFIGDDGNEHNLLNFGQDTPWAVNHNAAGFNLSNVGVFESNSGAPSTVGNIRLGNNQQIGWRDAGNTFDALLTYDGIDHFNFKTTNKRVILELEADHTSPSNGDEVGAIQFVDDNSVGTTRTYAQIGVSIEVPTSGVERAEMFFHLTDGTGIFDPYMIFNDENDGAITMKHTVQIEDTIDFKKITEPADPPTEEGRLYVKQINAATNGLFVKLKQANSITEVQLS